MDVQFDCREVDLTNLNNKIYMKAIQIIGTQRSGSNLIRVMLDQHPAICAPHPPHILDAFSPYLEKYGDLDVRDHFEELVEDVCKLVECNPVPWTGIKLDPVVVSSRCKVNSIMEIFRVIYELKAGKSDSRFWCCKSMGNFKYFNELELSGLKPFYLHLVRDGRDVAASFKRTSVGEKHIYHLASQWKKDQSMSNRIIDKIGPERGLRIYYEELIQSPEKTISAVCNWLGIDFDDSVLQYYLSKESALTALGGEMWANLRKPILSDNYRKFTRELTPNEVETFEAISGRELKMYGYSLNNPSNLLKKFTGDEVAGFDSVNNLLKSEAIANANPDDLKRRLPREKLQAKIAGRSVFLET